MGLSKCMQIFDSSYFMSYIWHHMSTLIVSALASCLSHTAFQTFFVVLILHLSEDTVQHSFEDLGHNHHFMLIIIILSLLYIFQHLFFLIYQYVPIGMGISGGIQAVPSRCHSAFARYKTAFITSFAALQLQIT